ncbi:MAG: hypothetical protein ACTSU4_02695 [Promethearchaeota archaeon]
MSEKAEYNEMDFLEKAEKGGLNYINKEKAYLKISMIFPLYSLCIIIINIFFIFIGSIFLRYTPHPPKFDLTVEQKIFIGLMLMIPSMVFLILTIFSLLQHVFLKKWKLKINEYNTRYIEFRSKQEQVEGNLDTSTTSTTTLTALFYEIVNHMEKIRIIFYIMNALAIFYFWWSLRMFGAIVYLLVEEIIEYFPFMFFLNFSSSVVLIIFLIYMWIHFKRWYRKLKNLRNFEKTIVNELNLQNENK